MSPNFRGCEGFFPKVNVSGSHSRSETTTHPDFTVIKSCDKNPRYSSLLELFIYMSCDLVNIFLLSVVVSILFSGSKCILSILPLLYLLELMEIDNAVCPSLGHSRCSLHWCIKETFPCAVCAGVSCLF